MSGLQRMSYVTEILHLLNTSKKIKLFRESFYRISFQANTLINSDTPNWYEQTLKNISNEVDKSIEDIMSLSSQWAQIPECLKYIQLGNPELIFIAPDNFLANPNRVKR